MHGCDWVCDEEGGRCVVMVCGRCLVMRVTGVETAVTKYVLLPYLYIDSL